MSGTRTYTARRRSHSDEYGSGREVEITASVEAVADEDLDPRMPDAWWAIRLSGLETRYGHGSSVLGQHGIDWDPDGEWRHDRRIHEPTREELRELADDLLERYVADHPEENWGEQQ